MHIGDILGPLDWKDLFGRLFEGSTRLDPSILSLKLDIFRFSLGLLAIGSLARE